MPLIVDEKHIRFTNLPFHLILEIVDRTHIFYLPILKRLLAHHVNLACFQRPISIKLAVKMVHLVQKHAGVKIVQTLLYFIALFAQIIYQDGSGSFDYRSHIRVTL